MLSAHNNKSACHAVKISKDLNSIQTDVVKAGFTILLTPGFLI